MTRIISRGRFEDVARRGGPEAPSLKWIHRVRERHYRRTKGLPIEAWLRPVNAKRVVQAFRRLGLRVRLPAKNSLLGDS